MPSRARLIEEACRRQQQPKPSLPPEKIKRSKEYQEQICEQALHKLLKLPSISFRVFFRETEFSYKDILLLH